MASVTQTTNFNYTYADNLTDPDKAAAISRANALAVACESDLATLQDWFGVSGEFGSSNRVTIVINNNAGLGSNFGYQSGGNTQIIIRPFTGASDGDAAAREVFVAEMSEVLMDYRNQQTGTATWIAGNSMGEALSTVFAALLPPEGYYTATIGSPRITSWLNFKPSPRPNWIDQNQPTDQNFVSFGCGIVFIYYLRSQLGYSIKDIITKAGSTLEETYKNLTGHSGGWTAFNNLLDLYFPDTVSSFYNPVSDNLFPLPQLASLTLSPETVVSGNNSIARITLNAPYPASDVTVTLLCGAPGFASVPTTVTIPAGASSAQFTVTTPPVAIPFKPALVNIYATYGRGTLSATLIVKSPINVGILASLTLFANRVTGGNASRGRVTLLGPVPTDTVVGLAAVEPGQRLALPDGLSSVASVPPSVTIPAGQTTASFRIQTQALSFPTVTRAATIIAGAVDVKYALLTVKCWDPDLGLMPGSRH